MNERKQKLAIGCLLHDFGKLLYRFNDGRNHSTSGFEYLKDVKALSEEEEILNCVRYHHAKQLSTANISENDIAYVAYIADNIASAADRRKKENDDGEGGFVKGASLETIFNILNDNNEKKVYQPKSDEIPKDINYPTDKEITFDEGFYSNIISNIRNLLNQIEFNDNYINSLLQVLEANLTFVPSSTNMGELRDISLYDHLKLTAAFGLCIEQYLTEYGLNNYKAELYENAKDFYTQKAFLIYSLDISGIQSFIYNIASKGALKGLRARSFYLEILMESSVDELLDRLELCRANVLYTGGGHTYMLLPNTENTKEKIASFEKELNKWFMDNFGSQLYAAGGFAECSAETLQNIPDGSYKEIFRSVSKSISAKKINRYSAEDIEAFNAPHDFDSARECVICHRSDKLSSENKCSVCSGLEKLSTMIIDDKKALFVLTKALDTENSVIMPFDTVLTAGDENKVKKLMQTSDYVRSYSKNLPYTGNKVTSNLWVGDYCSDNDFSKLIEKSKGIKRLGVIRADVDNLGRAFVSGFSGPYETITRTAVFSRKLSMFFKLHINKLLEKGGYNLDESEPEKRNATIVYAGGDDLFIVGAWDDIIGFSVDLKHSLERYSQGKLTLSAGIGIYPDKFPISAMAEQTGELEHLSKTYNNESKNSVTLFGEGIYDPNDKEGREKYIFENTYHWDEFIDEVLLEKLFALQQYIKNNDEHDKALLYKMLQLIRDRKKEDKLNISRFTYLVARMSPDKENTEEVDAYNYFAQKMYQWIRDEKHCRQLVTAIYLYVYMNRERTEEYE
ncbi:MAG: type III-A CRISPR-associated protein Cas10/Csm1 [Firmicutes bacterium]|nr:type III-A CRISPR-associated protein Cas10/Csm1 [Bacillota bacterium]